MSDEPTRLLEDSSTDFARSLILAGREEEPEAEVIRRTLVAVGVGAALAPNASAVSSAASSPLGMVVKWLALGVLIGAVASSTIYGIAGALESPPAPSVTPRLQVAPAAPRMTNRSPDAVHDLPDIPPPPVK